MKTRRDAMLLPVSKKDAVSAFLQTTDIQLLLDARQDGVVVPAKFAGSKKLALHLGLKTVIPIPDLELSEHGISATLSFNRSPFKCVIPWKSVYAIILLDSGRCLLFQQDAPADVEMDFVHVEDDDTTATPTVKSKQKKKKAQPETSKNKRPSLQILDGGKKDSSVSAPRTEANYLKIVT